MDSLNQMSRYCYRPAFGLLLIRVITGLVFMHHGWMKLTNIPGMSGFFASIGLPLFVFYAVAFVEFFGGAMLVFGVLTRAAAVATGIVALVAALLVKIPHGGLFSAELELMLALVSFGIAFVGAGTFRLLHIFEHDREQLVSPARTNE